eukprot:11459-Heterococcus_DN1.PRE.3
MAAHAASRRAVDVLLSITRAVQLADLRLTHSPSNHPVPVVVDRQQAAHQLVQLPGTVELQLTIITC